MNDIVNVNMPRQTSHFFKNLCIFVVPILIGKKRLILFESQICKEGGKVCSVSEVKSGQVNPTLIVVEESLLQDSQILEQHLKTFKVGCLNNIVGTKWLSDSIKFNKCMAFEGYKPSHDACPPPKKPKLTGNSGLTLSNCFSESEPSCSKETIELDVSR